MPATHHSAAPSTNGTTASRNPTRQQDEPAETAETAGPAESGNATATPPARAVTPPPSATTPPARADAPPSATERPPAEAPRPAGAQTPVDAQTPAAAQPTADARPASDAQPAAGIGLPSVGRIPVLDVRPVVQRGRRPAKAVAGETFQVTATVFREGHDAVAANVVLRDPEGRPGPWTPMRELAPGTDRWGGAVTAGEPGRWTYTVEAWSDPVGTWRHTAGVKIPAGIDTELVLEEGARLHERAAAGVPEGQRGVVLEAVAALRDEGRPAAWRLAAALAPEVEAVLSRYPVRDLVTASDPMPLLVERERALYGSWYEFFPRSEGTPARPHGTFRTAERRLKAIAE
ncbi:maltotransferase domain-containing protein, partial [Streptomyces sp. NPDC048297]|uniref:maltotransferase domain-containing protein n=1 Tax=Streptomyces sp. NPDC048297 TaxID=3365531 RepID=UPI003711D1BF